MNTFMIHLICVNVSKKGLIFFHDRLIARQCMHRSRDQPLSTHFLLSCFRKLPKSNFKVDIIPVGQFSQELWRITWIIWGCVSWVQLIDRRLNSADLWFKKGGNKQSVNAVWQQNVTVQMTMQDNGKATMSPLRSNVYKKILNLTLQHVIPAHLSDNTTGTSVSPFFHP